MKKGFTLIELLAVIVILAIIALIAVPIVLNIINESKESSLLRSAEFYLDAAEYTIADAFLYHGGLEDKEYPITKDGDICKVSLDSNNNCPKDGDKSNTLIVEVNGEKPTGGYIKVTSGDIFSVELVIDEKTIIKNSKGELVYLKYLEEVCTLVSGTAKTKGAKYSCKVDPNKDAYTFYVLTTPSSTDTNINLILDRNMCSNGNVATEDNTCYVAWISEEERYKDVGGVIPDEILNDDGPCEGVGYCTLNDKGPVTAMNYITEATKNWINTNEMIIDEFFRCDSFDKCTIEKMERVYNTYARIPYLSEVDNSNGTNEYLYENLDGENWYGFDASTKPKNNISGIYGYWILSSSFISNYPVFAWYVSSYGSVEGNGSVDFDYNYGVRPVITYKNINKFIKV